MHNIFNMDNKFFQIMGKLSDLIILNILFSLCSLPIITMGASITAMYYVTLKMVKDTESHIAKSFFKSFCQNFKQATGIWMLILLSVGIIVGDIYIITHYNTPLEMPLMIIFIALAFMLVFIFSYVFPLLAQFDNTVKQTFKNALLMSIRHLPYTILIIIITIVPLVLYSISSRLMYMAFMVGFSIIAFLNSFFFNKIFKIYMPEELEDEIVSDEDYVAGGADRGDYSVFQNPLTGQNFDSTAALMESLAANQKKEEEARSNSEE